MIQLKATVENKQVYSVKRLPGRDMSAVFSSTPDTEPLPEKIEGLSTC